MQFVRHVAVGPGMACEAFWSPFPPSCQADPRGDRSRISPGACSRPDMNDVKACPSQPKADGSAGLPIASIRGAFAPIDWARDGAKEVSMIGTPGAAQLRQGAFPREFPIGSGSPVGSQAAGRFVIVSGPHSRSCRLI